MARGLLSSYGSPMTMTAREIEHQVRQLDNDVHEIYVAQLGEILRRLPG